MGEDGKIDLKYNTLNFSIFISTQDVFSCYDIPTWEDYEPLMALGTLTNNFPPQDLSLFDKLLDVVVWEQTKDLDQAKASARLILEKNLALENPIQCLVEVKKLLVNETK